MSQAKLNAAVSTKASKAQFAAPELYEASHILFEPSSTTARRLG